MIARWRRITALIAVFLSMVLAPCAANATALYCNGNGGVGGGQIFYADSQSNAGACAYRGVQHMLSEVICDFVVVLDDVMGKVYCAMQYSMIFVIRAILTLYVAIFGMQILMGSARLNPKEVIFRLLKIAGVVMFATQSTWGISYAFAFFAAFMSEGVWWVIKSVLPAAAPTAGNIMPAIAYMDDLVFQLIAGPITNANAKVIGFFAALLVIFPTMPMLGLQWLWLTISMVSRSILSFMLALSALAFLITVSPIFLSFMLFHVTFYLFEGWLRYLMSFVLQVIVIFTIIAMWMGIISYFIDFFNQLSDLVVPFRGDTHPGAMSEINYTWGICPPVFGATAFGPTAYCQAGYDPVKDVIYPTKIINQTDFIYFCMYHFASLILVTYCFSIMIKNAPDIARDLVGPGQAPPLGAGVPGAQMSPDGKRGPGKEPLSDRQALRHGKSNIGNRARRTQAYVENMMGRGSREIAGRYSEMMSRRLAGPNSGS